MNPTTKQPDFRRVAPGVYKYKSGAFYERARVNGKPTWRRLHALTLSDAKTEHAAKRADHQRAKLGLAVDPYAKRKPVTVGELLDLFEREGLPGHDGQAKQGRSRDDELKRLPILAAFWADIPVKDVTYGLAQSYGAKRRQGLAPGVDGGRTIDLELGTLAGALRNALRHGLIDQNPLAGNRPKFRRSQDVEHCREFMPQTTAELHQLAAWLFSNRRTEPLAWQFVLEAMTGLRTAEVLQLRTDARSRLEPGFVEGDWLWVKRAKGGINPFVRIHPDLADALAAHRAWLQDRFPRGVYFVPGKLDQGLRPATPNALAAALRKSTKALGLPKRTSHGLRAYFVTVRRAQGATDAQIAAEIGDATGEGLIASTYGAIPPDWRGQNFLRWTEPGTVAPWLSLGTGGTGAEDAQPR